IGEIAVDARDFADVVTLTSRAVADLVTLIAKALLHRNPHIARIDQLNLAAAWLRFPIRQNPQISRDAGVVEKLVGQSDDRFEPIVLDDPATDFRFAAASVAGEQRGTIENDADAAAALFRIAHLREHMLEKKE